MHPDLVEYGPVRFHGDPNALYERHLLFDYAIDPDLASPRERYEAVARSLRDVLALRWLRTKKTYYRADPKRAYYLSMEFLIGRSLASNVCNLLLYPAMREACREKNVDWYELLDQEPDAGLGNGGLGRLLHGIHGHSGPPGDGLRPALRIRDLQAIDPKRLAERKTGQLAPPAGSLGGGPAGPHRRGQAELLVSDSRRASGSGARKAFDSPRHSL